MFSALPAGTSVIRNVWHDLVAAVTQMQVMLAASHQFELSVFRAVWEPHFADCFFHSHASHAHQRCAGTMPCRKLSNCRRTNRISSPSRSDSTESVSFIICLTSCSSVALTRKALLSWLFSIPCLASALPRVSNFMLLNIWTCLLQGTSGKVRFRTRR